VFRLDKGFLISTVVLGALCAFPLTAPTSFSIDEAKDLRFEQIPEQLGEWKGKEQ